MNPERIVKCVVWDLDDTLWDGVALERPDDSLPEPKPEILDAVDALAGRGVLSSIASRTAPYLAAKVRAHPQLAERFVVPQLCWDDKSTSLRRIADELGLAIDSLVLVDDSSFERAQVRTALPEIEALDPTEVPQWLQALRTPSNTAEARSRVRLYHQQQRREEAARDFSGTPEEFYRECDMRLHITPATLDDLDRVIELAERTHRLNSTNEVPERAWLAQALENQRWFVPVARLSDVFGDYGLIGAALVHRGPEEAPDTWWVRLLALSCRIAGRGVGLAFLRSLMDQAGRSGATQLAVDSRPTEANTQLRVLFKQCGLRVPEGETGTGLTTLWRSLKHPLPTAPTWLEPTEERSGNTEQTVRDLLAETTGRDRADIARLPSDVSLFSPEIALTSVQGMQLLAAVKKRYGVDVAADDLNLDALESIAHLCAFIDARR